MKTMTPSIMGIFGKYENFNENFSNMKRRPLRKTTQIQKTLIFLLSNNYGMKIKSQKY